MNPNRNKPTAIAVRGDLLTQSSTEDIIDTSVLRNLSIIIFMDNQIVLLKMEVTC